MQGVAILVFLCSMVIPLVKLLCQLLVMISVRFGIARHIGMLLYRGYHHLREWGCSRSTLWASWFPSSS